MIRNLKRLNFFLNTKQKRRFGIMFLGLLTLALLEVLSTAIFLPLIQLLQSKDLSFLEDSRFLSAVFVNNFTRGDHKNTLMFVTGLIAVIYLIKLMFSLALSWYKNLTVFGFQRDLMNDLYKRFMNKSFSDYLELNSSGTIQVIFTEVNQIRTTVGAIVIMMTELLISTSMAGMAIIYDYTVSGAAFVFFTVVYFIWNRTSKSSLVDLGATRKKNERQRLKVFQTTFLSFKEILVSQKQHFFLKRWYRFNRRVALALTRFTYRQETVKPIVEFVSILSICMLIIYFLMSDQGDNLFISLGFFAAIAYKLLPSLNKMMSARQLVTFNQVAIESVRNELENTEPTQLKPVQQKPNPMAFNKDIELRDVEFSYSANTNKVFDRANCIMPRGKFIGIVGESGSGKSTLADLFLGTLSPQKGKVLVDGQDISRNIEGWWNKIGYVSQRVNLLEDTIRNNILLGETETDDDKLWNVLKAVRLDDFVRKTEHGLDTELSENGLNISGGQKQRMLIARVLYQDPEVLLMDEATSSLDSTIEQQIISELNNIRKNITIVFITHRESTLLYCDVIFKVKNGTIVMVNSKTIS